MYLVFLFRTCFLAWVAELVDAPVSKTGGVTPMPVRPRP